VWGELGGKKKPSLPWGTPEIIAAPRLSVPEKSSPREKDRAKSSGERR